jgi:hypothetical protein
VTNIICHFPSARLLDTAVSTQSPPTGELEYHAEMTEDYQQVLSYDGARGSAVKALRYKPEGRGFDSRW